MLTQLVKPVYMHITAADVHAGRASKSPTAISPANSPASVMLGKGQQLGQQNMNKAQAVPFKPQRLTRLDHVPIDNPDTDPEFPPGFEPAVRIHSTQQYPSLATESNKTHPPMPNLSNSTSAAGHLTFSLAAAKRNQTPSPPPGLHVASQADETAPLSLHTHTAGAESESHKLNCNGAPVAAPHLSNCNSQQSGSSDEQPKQQGWDHQSGLQLHQAPEPSGWDVDSESEDGAAWTVGGNNKCNWETHNQQDNEASSVPRCAWQPNQFQGNNAKGTGFFTPIILQKPQQQQCMHNNHQYSPDPLARTPFNSTKDHTERDQRMPIRVGGWNPDTFQGQKAPYHVGGWNPDRYQGTGAAAYSDADVSTVEKQPQQPSAVQDDSLKSLLSFAFPQAPSLHKTSEATRPALVHARAEQPDSDLNDSLGRMHIQRPTSSSASGRQKQELGAHSEIPCGATPLPSQKASQMQSEQHEGWSHSCISQSRPERSAASPGGFGSHTSHARSSERICAQSIHHSLSSITEKELLHNSGAQLATNSSANNDHNGQDRQHSPSRQHCQDSGQLEGAVPLGVGSEANDADGVQPEEDNAKGCDSDGDDAKGVDPGEDDVGEVSSDIDDAMGGDSEGVAPGYTAQVGEGRVTCSS